MKRTESPSRKGDLAEYYAVTWLWDNGYEVFQNSGCDGPIDIIAMDSKGEMLLIDVKTGQLDKRTYNKSTDEDRYGATTSRTEKQLELGVKILVFIPTSRKLRFVEHKE